MENEKIEVLEKKLKISKILHIMSITISALAIVLSVVALGSNFMGKGNNMPQNNKAPNQDMNNQPAPSNMN